MCVYIFNEITPCLLLLTVSRETEKKKNQPSSAARQPINNKRFAIATENSRIDPIRAVKSDACRTIELSLQAKCVLEWVIDDSKAS